MGKLQKKQITLYFKSLLNELYHSKEENNKLILNKIYGFMQAILYLDGYFYEELNIELNKVLKRV